ncbi:unnamed protein product [[Actinomadura] parvosata subsp. kistnae]|uniref:NlpC/P60 domain-containing protein n=1 Tax=[Actinomadura] parvosata subsp. kistnae TaxID=1909395 RepID=A0A1V0A0G8_9ACTN|nr:NlpC/P60 family protein [Nonomuraea sp. ATCC 55076]AQZ63687.1 hypothetical protein BKM31_21470 [Nonomuraea sp. ATCC 55076]SPL99486.1 unnamed protein product [Actinomadura parvosata subsp. kistnae]
MILDTGTTAKALATGGGLITGAALIIAMSGGTSPAAASTDPGQMGATNCEPASPMGQDGSPPGTLGAGGDGNDLGLPGASARRTGKDGSGPAQRTGQGGSDLGVLGLSARQAANAGIIVDVAAQLQLPRRAAEIAVATALRESRLDNNAVSAEGRSFGLFQQTPAAGWGTREQVTTPGHAARSFYKRLVGVRNWATLPLTQAAATVQRPRADLRGAYAKHEKLARKLVASLWPERGLAAGKQDTRPLSEGMRPGTMPEQGAGLPQRDAGRPERRTGLPGREAGTSERGAGLSGDALEPGCGEIGAASLAVSAALAQRGIPYSYGGGGPAGPGYGIGRGARTKGFDCSGLTEYAWSKAGVRIGGTTYEQVGKGLKIPRSQVRAGDLVFYETDASRPGPDHVGLAVSSTEMVNAPRTGTVVRLDTIDRPSYVTAVRPSAMEPGRR